MTTTPGSTPPSASAGAGGRGPATPNAWAVGGATFAGVLMAVNGVFSVFEGIAALAKDDVYLPVGDYTFKFNLTSWGWIHLVLGVIVFVVGVGILKGAQWGRIAGVVLAAVTVLIHFLWLPYQPLWALISIAIGVFVIWALCTDRPAARI
ncbi:hypothetical protein [Streptomyces sp. RerS4]|uniref:DUF7144 family membrane protein n=1 Tax=Streptomyces sp. RerS4 TaxID=2942449 RepID=UPI00201BA68E|nr:hypothetical protein [Streptomyces sp. RerS4]UQX01345.1 hypothetical protein M4D82_13025 [Streptomyces sp. RerS4]